MTCGSGWEGVIESAISVSHTGSGGATEVCSDAIEVLLFRTVIWVPVSSPAPGPVSCTDAVERLSRVSAGMMSYWFVRVGVNQGILGWRSV